MAGENATELSALVTALREVLLAGDTYRQAAASRLDITGTESRVISYLVTRGPMQPNELAEAIGVSSGSITAIIDSLAAHDLIDRRAHPTDRRRSVVYPTEVGSVVLASAASWLDDVGRLFPAAERADVTRILETVAAGLRERAVTVLHEPLPSAPEPD